MRTPLRSGQTLLTDRIVRGHRREGGFNVEWVFAILVIGSLVCAGGIVIEYTNYATGMGSRIRALEDGISDLDLEANAEAELLVESKKRLTNLKASVDDLRRQSVTLRDRLKDAQSRKQKLDMAVFRKRLKLRERLVSA